MKAVKVFVTLVLLLISSKSTFQQFAGCRESYFLHEGTCTSCPDRCATCISDLNCTKCCRNYYGPVCQYTCPQDCDDLCHKEHGYCTYGCADGRFPDPNSSLCLKCLAKCKTCKSMTECFECIPGYYGNSCENRCSSYCERCDKTTGACLLCAEGFNHEGQCRRCSDGCESCSDENNCSSCQSGYYTLKGGQCIMECPIAFNTSDLEATTHFMEDMMAHGCTDTPSGQRFVIKTKKPCIQYTKCSPNSMCTPQYEGKSACGTIKTYQCSHSCRQLNESCCRCEPNCTIIEEGLFSMTLCFTNEHACTDIKLSTESECSNVSEGPPVGTAQPRAALIVVLMIITVMFAVCVSLVFIRLMKRHNLLRKCLDVDVDSIEPIGNEAITMVPKESEATVITLRSQDLEIDETSYLNVNDSNVVTVDNVKAEEEPMSFSTSVELMRANPNQRSNYVDSYPYTRGSQSTVYCPTTRYFGSDVFTY